MSNQRSGASYDQPSDSVGGKLTYTMCACRRARPLISPAPIMCVSSSPLVSSLQLVGFKITLSLSLLPAACLTDAGSQDVTAGSSANDTVPRCCG